MPFNLKDIQNRGATVDVAFYGEIAKITYDPVKLTASFRADYLQRAQELNAEIRRKRQESVAPQEADADGNAQEQEPFDSTRAVFRADAELMLLVVKDWNIIGLDDEKLPLELDAVVENLPNPLVNKIAAEVWADVSNLGKPMSSTNTSNSNNSSSG